MPASYPKPDGAKVTRHKPRFDWVDLPVAHEVEAPELPEWRIWHAKTVEVWVDLWSKPQAVMWDPAGSSLFVWATLIDDLISARSDAVKVSGEIRQIEDRHGLTPKAMMQLRWRIVDDEGHVLGQTDELPDEAPVSTAAKLRDRLRVVTTDGEKVYPKHRGAGWYELSNGEKIRGKGPAEAAEMELGT